MTSLVRSLLICLLVASLSYWIQGMEMARGLPDLDKGSNPLEWVRTQDGWERSLVLQPRSQEPGLVHPLVVAGLQLLVSMLVLQAFPFSTQPASRVSQYQESHSDKPHFRTVGYKHDEPVSGSLGYP